MEEKGRASRGRELGDLGPKPSGAGPDRTTPEQPGHTNATAFENPSSASRGTSPSSREASKSVRGASPSSIAGKDFIITRGGSLSRGVPILGVASRGNSTAGREAPTSGAAGLGHFITGMGPSTISTTTPGATANGLSSPIQQPETAEYSNFPLPVETSRPLLEAASPPRTPGIIPATPTSGDINSKLPAYLDPTVKPTANPNYLHPPGTYLEPEDSVTLKGDPATASRRKDSDVPFDPTAVVAPLFGGKRLAEAVSTQTLEQGGDEDDPERIDDGKVGSEGSRGDDEVSEVSTPAKFTAAEKHEEEQAKKEGEEQKGQTEKDGKNKGKQTGTSASNTIIDDSNDDNNFDNWVPANTGHDRLSSEFIGYEDLTPTQLGEAPLETQTRLNGTRPAHLTSPLMTLYHGSHFFENPTPHTGRTDQGRDDAASGGHIFSTRERTNPGPAQCIGAVAGPLLRDPPDYTAARQTALRRAHEDAARGEGPDPNHVIVLVHSQEPDEVVAFRDYANRKMDHEYLKLGLAALEAVKSSGNSLIHENNWLKNEIEKKNRALVVAQRNMEMLHDNHRGRGQRILDPEMQLGESTREIAERDEKIKRLEEQIKDQRAGASNTTDDEPAPATHIPILRHDLGEANEKIDEKAEDLERGYQLLTRYYEESKLTPTAEWTAGHQDSIEREIEHFIMLAIESSQNEAGSRITEEECYKRHVEKEAGLNAEIDRLMAMFEPMREEIQALRDFIVSPRNSEFGNVDPDGALAQQLEIVRVLYQKVLNRQDGGGKIIKDCYKCLDDLYKEFNLTPTNILLDGADEDVAADISGFAKKLFEKYNKEDTGKLKELEEQLLESKEALNKAVEALEEVSKTNKGKNPVGDHHNKNLITEENCNDRHVGNTTLFTDNDLGFDFVILRCEVALQDMAKKRATHGRRDGDMDSAIQIAQEAMQMAEDSGDEQFIGRAYFWTGVALYYDEQESASAAYFDIAKENSAWLEPDRERRWLEEWIKQCQRTTPKDAVGYGGTLGTNGKRRTSKNTHSSQGGSSERIMSTEEDLDDKMKRKKADNKKPKKKVSKHSPVDRPGAPSDFKDNIPKPTSAKSKKKQKKIKRPSMQQELVN